MGEIEQVIAEVDEDIDVDGLHPTTLNQENPWIITQVVTAVTTLIASNGWYALGFFFLVYVVWLQIQPKYAVWKKKREDDQESAAYHKDPDRFLAREMAIDRARQRMQEQYNQSAVEWAQKQEEQEEKKRKERIEDWERHERGEGYKNKSRLKGPASPPVPAATGNDTTKEKKNGKPKLRPEYNPMTGDVGGGPCRWRPDRRGPTGGG